MAHPDTRHISFTYLPVTSMWVVVTLHSLFLYSDPPLPSQPPSCLLRLFSNQTFSHINTPTFLEPSSFFTPAYEDGTDGVFRNVGISNSDTGNYPEESIQHSEHSESLKWRIPFLLSFTVAWDVRFVRYEFEWPWDTLLSIVINMYRHFGGMLFPVIQITWHHVSGNHNLYYEAVFIAV